MKMDAFYRAVEDGNIEAVNQLLNDPEVKARAHTQENKALRMACERGYRKIVKRLFDIPAVVSEVLNGAPHREGYQALLSFAIDHKRTDLIKRIGYNLDPSARTTTLLSEMLEFHERLEEWNFGSGEEYRPSASRPAEESTSKTVLETKKHSHNEETKSDCSTLKPMKKGFLLPKK